MIRFGSAMVPFLLEIRWFAERKCQVEPSSGDKLLMQLKPKTGKKEETGSADGRAEAVNEAITRRPSCRFREAPLSAFSPRAGLLAKTRRRAIIKRDRELVLTSSASARSTKHGVW